MSDQWFTSTTLATSLCDISFASYHGLSHARNISSTNILWTVHLAIWYNSLPRVRSVALSLNIFMIHLFAFNICIPAEFNLLLPLLGPFLELNTAMCLALTFQILLCILLLIEFFLAFLSFLLHTLNSLAFFIIKVVVILSLHPWASWSRLEAPVHPCSSTLARPSRSKTIHPFVTGEAESSTTKIWLEGPGIWLASTA